MLEPIIRKNAFGGKGEVTLRPLLTDEQKNEKFKCMRKSPFLKALRLASTGIGEMQSPTTFLPEQVFTPTTEKPMKSMRVTRHTAPMAITTDLKIRETAT